VRSCVIKQIRRLFLEDKNDLHLKLPLEIDKAIPFRDEKLCHVQEKFVSHPHRQRSHRTK